MQFRRFKTPGIAHNAYVIGTKGIGIVIDPRRDVEHYLEFAAKESLTIQYVLQTHRQEDFVIGSQVLRAALGARVVAGKHPVSSNADVQLADGEVLDIGDLSFRILFTPGHTPESVSYAISMKKHSQKVWAVFTGDALFIGETGRTDLLDPNKTAENAAILYESIHCKILPLGDSTLLYPAHGAGSVCGGKIADYDESTIGFERTYNKVFTLTKDDFVKMKVQERIPRPPYFTVMEELNLKGGEDLPRSWNYIPLFSPQKFAEQSKSGVVIDTRNLESFAAGHIPDSFSIWLDGLPVFGGWIAAQKQPLFLLVERSKDIEKALLSLARIGFDNVKGVLSGGFEAWRDAGMSISTCGTLSCHKLEESKIPVLDVREVTEYEEGHISGAYNVFVGFISDKVPEILKKYPKNEPLVVTCSVGHRASVAISVLQRNGYQNISNLLGGMDAWKKLKLPLQKGEER
jgi:hydroxyacylglutathione hydrolase